MFQEYIVHGWALCPIKAGEKGPRSKGWNLSENAIRDSQIANGLKAAGLCHAYSGTCAFDIDDLARTVALVPEVADYFLDPSMVRIDSGRPNRAKFIFALPVPLASKTFAGGAFELRCSTSTGRTAQDVLPPSPHPSGTTYKWVGDWRQLPLLPPELTILWMSELQPADSKSQILPTSSNTDNVSVQKSRDLAELEALVSKRDPSCGYDEWIKIGMAIHHESDGNDAGFALWDAWSNKSDKYPGIGQLRAHWQSFGRSATPVTADTLRRTEVAGVDEFDFLELRDDSPKLNPFRFLSCPELFQRPEPEWLISEALPQKGLGCFWGQPGSGKTFLAVDIAISVAAGSHWRGSPVKTPGKVLYIAAEDDNGVQVRLRSAFARNGLSDTAIRVLPTSPVFTSTKQSDALLESIRGEGKSSLVFVDTLAAVTPGADENSSKDIGPLVSFCRKIEHATGALVILVHHSRKDGDEIRGSSSLHAAFDVEWKVTDEKTHREIRISKMKNGEANKSYAFSLSLIGLNEPDADGNVRTSCTVEWA